jgi:hypothetical protein
MTRHAESSDVLAGGAWVVVRGVSRWVAEVAPVELTLVPDLEPEPAWLTFTVCPKCLATMTEPCWRLTNGKPRHAHTGRLIPRRCTCGAVLQKYRSLCHFCRIERRQAQRQADYAKRRLREAS